MGMSVGASGGLWYFNRINDLNSQIAALQSQLDALN